MKYIPPEVSSPNHAHFNKSKRRSTLFEVNKESNLIDTDSTPPPSDNDDSETELKLDIPFSMMKAKTSPILPSHKREDTEVSHLSTLPELSDSEFPTLNDSYLVDADRRGLAVIILASMSLLDDSRVDADIKHLKGTLITLKFEVQIFVLSSQRELRESPSLSRLSTERGYPFRSLTAISESIKIETKSNNYTSLFVFTIGNLISPMDVNKNLSFKVSNLSDASSFLSSHNLSNKLQDVMDQKPKIFIYNFLTYEPVSVASNALLCQDIFFCYFSQKSSANLSSHSFLHYLNEELVNASEELSFHDIFLQARIKTHRSLMQSRLVNTIDYTFFVNNTLTKPLYLDYNNLMIKLKAQRFNGDLLSAVKKSYNVSSNTNGHGLFLVITTHDTTNQEMSDYWSKAKKYLTKLKTYFISKKFSVDNDIILINKPQYSKYTEMLKQKMKTHNYDCVVIFFISCDSSPHRIGLRDKNDLSVQTIANELSSFSPGTPKIIIFSQVQMESKKNNSITKTKSACPSLSPIFAKFETSSLKDIYIAQIVSRYRGKMACTFIGTLSAVLLSKHRRKELHKVMQYTKDQYEIVGTQDAQPNPASPDILYYQEIDALKCKFILFNENDTLSDMLKLRGKEFKEAYEVACLEGTEMFRFFRLMIVGPEGVGKTSLLKSLTGKTFEENEVSTSFIEKFDLSVQTISNDWTETQDIESYAQNLDDVRQNMAINFIAHTHCDLIDQCKNQSQTEEDSSNPAVNNLFNTDNCCNIDYSEYARVNTISPQNITIKQTCSVENFQDLSEDKLKNESSLHQESFEIGSERLTGTNNINKAPTNSTAHECNENNGTDHMDFPLEKIHDKLIGEYETTSHPDFFTVWDFAGQSYLYCFHSLFLSPRAIYLLLVDLSVENLYDPIKIRTERVDRLDLRSQAGVPTSYLEAIEFWMNAIYFVSKSSPTSSYLLSAKILLIFSKADSVDNPEERARAHFAVIKEHINKRNNSFSLVYQTQELFIISCLPSSEYSYNTQSLKDQINKVSDMVAFNQEIPIKWLEFARCLLKDKQSIIDMRHIERMADMCWCRENLTDLLHLFHDIGFFFLHDSLIIKDIQSFLNLLFHIISPQSSTLILKSISNPAESILLQSDIELCIHEGKLTHNLLDAIFHYLNLTFVKTELISMLLKYGVLIDDASNNSTISYYVPYLLKGTLPELTNHIQNPTEHFTCYIYFPDGFIPASLYFTLLSWLLQKSKNRHQSVKPQLAFDIACFHFSPWLKVVVDFSTCKTYIRLLFIEMNPNANSQSTIPRDYLNSEIFELLISIQIAILKIQAQLIPCGNASKIVFECPCKQLYLLSHMQQPCVFLDQLLSLDAKNRQSWCHIKQSYVDWNRCFNDEDYILQNLINYNDNSLMATFILQNIQIFAAHFSFTDLMPLLYKFGLTTSDKIYTYLIGRVQEELNSLTLLGELVHKGPYWAFRLYLALSRDFSNPGHQYLRHYIDYHLNLGYFSLANRDNPRSTLSGSYKDRYIMNCNPHGIALLVNIENFSHDTQMKRKGSNFDLQSLRDSFEQLQYLVHLYQDLTRVEFKKVLISIARTDHSQYDSFVCIIMSHGDEYENIIFNDGQLVSKAEIYRNFSPLYCKSLSGKPKIFIFQSCRGTSIEPSVLSENENFSSSLVSEKGNDNTYPNPFPQESYIHSFSSEQEQLTPVSSPLVTSLNNTQVAADRLFEQTVRSNSRAKISINDRFQRSISIEDEYETFSEMSDVFIGNSSLQNYVSYRNVYKGSLFIQCFCKVIKYSRYEEFLHIMNEVRRKVSRVSRSYIQCTEDINHLRKKLYFY